MRLQKRKFGAFGSVWLTGIKTFSGGPIRPHVTLAHGLELDLDLEPFVKALEERLALQSTFDLTFTGLSLFDPDILYLTTRMTEALWTLHRPVAALVEKQGGDSSLYYRPDFWTPHCTLAINLTPAVMLEAVRVCQSVSLPVTASVTRIGIIEPSERELLALPLKVR